jgi:hypothetical protein
MQGKNRHLSEIHLCQRNQIQVKIRHNKIKGVRQRKVPKPGKRTPPRHQKNKKKGMRQHKKPHQVLPNRNKARPSGRSYTLGVHAIRLRRTRRHQNIQSLRTTQTSWPKESTIGQLRSLKTPTTKGTEFKTSWTDMRQVLDQIREAQRAAEEQNHSPQH